VIQLDVAQNDEVAIPALHGLPMRAPPQRLPSFHLPTCWCSSCYLHAVGVMQRKVHVGLAQHIALRSAQAPRRVALPGEASSASGPDYLVVNASIYRRTKRGAGWSASTDPAADSRIVVLSWRQRRPARTGSVAR